MVVVHTSLYIYSFIATILHHFFFENYDDLGGMDEPVTSERGYGLRLATGRTNGNDWSNENVYFLLGLLDRMG